MLGFALLAVGESRAILLLFSDGLNRHARVHLRSLFEYELKTGLLLDEDHDDRVLKFRDAFAYEQRKFAPQLNVGPSAIEANIARFLGVNDALAVVGTKEKDAFGGDGRRQMKDKLQPEKRYAGTVAWTSQVSHGSILALAELAAAVEGRSEDVLAHAAIDDKGNALLYYALWTVLYFVVVIEQWFGIGVPGVDQNHQTSRCGQQESWHRL